MEQLSGLDAAFLYLESADQPMHVVLCAVLDPSEGPEPLTAARFRDHVRTRLGALPLMTRHLVNLPLHFHRPFWAHDPDVDLDHHVRHVTLAAPGGRAELEGLCAELASIPLDRDRPLWELWHVDGLEDDRIAVIAKVHHSVLDGIAGVVQLVALFDLEPTDPAAVATPAPELPPADAVPNRLELSTWAAVDRLRTSTRLLPTLGRLTRSVTGIATARRRPEVPIGGTPLLAPTTPFNGAFDGQRTVAFGRVSLDEIGVIRKAVVGSTVNDVVLAVCAGALREYLIAHDLPVDRPLLAACPVNVRRDEHSDRTGNRVSVMFVKLPVQEADPLRRLHEAHHQSRGAKDEHEQIGDDLLQDLLDQIDPNTLRTFRGVYAHGLAGHHPPPVNCVISNVPGPPFPLFLAGAKLERVLPMGQILGGIGLNITVMSYQDAVDIGMLAATSLAPDLSLLRDAIETSFDELRAAAH